MTPQIQRFPLPPDLREIFLSDGPGRSCEMTWFCAPSHQKQTRTVRITNLCSQYVLLGFGQEKKVRFMMIARPSIIPKVPIFPYLSDRRVQLSDVPVQFEADYTHIAIATFPKSVSVHVEEIRPKKPFNLLTCIRTAWETGYAALKEGVLAAWGTPHET